MAASLRDKAAEAFAKGRFARAAELYAAHCQSDARDLQARLRMGDAFARAGDRTAAISAYTSAAEAFARDGFLPRAIAASKLILELDPAHQGVQGMLARLYARKGGAAPKQSAAVAAPASAAPRPALELPPPERSRSFAPLAGAPPSSPEVVSPSSVVSADEHERSGLPPELDLDLVQPREKPPQPSPQASPFDELSLEDAPGAPQGEGESLLHALESLVMGDTASPEPGGLIGHRIEEDEEVFSLTLEVSEGTGGAPLPRIPLFSDLPEDAFVELFSLCPLRRLNAGDRIFSQGSPGDAFYVVCEGAVRVVREDAEGRRELARLTDGAFFGEMALLSSSPRTASVESASDDTQVLEIPAAVLAKLSTRFPSVATALRKFCRQRMLSNVMNTSALFAPFARSERRTLVERFRAREVAGGERLITAGQETDGLYIVLSGEVEVRRAGRTIARLVEGQIFGEMSLLKKQPAAADVVAVRRTSLLRLPRADFDALVLSHPQILVLVAELTDERQAQLETEAVARPAPERGDAILV